MTQTVTGLRGEILRALEETEARPSVLTDGRTAIQVPVSYTVHALARHISASPSKVEHELRKMKREGSVVVRVTRGNDVLYKLPDSNHNRWMGSANTINLPKAGVR